MIRAALVTLLLSTGPAALADEVSSPEALPPELRPFVEPGTKAIWLAKGDLDRDGREDAILVLERLARTSEDGLEEQQRPLLIVLRQADGSLRVAKRNDRVVMCSDCGGVMGDPFQGVEAGPGTFTVSHYGGSAWRWTEDYRFNWSRKDRTWQLVRVEETSFHTMEPDKVERHVATPPKDFGKIDFADFDPSDWKGRGPR
jgi:hypothetical protein